MTGRLVRCPHCEAQHDILLAVCPTTGRPLRGTSGSAPRRAPAIVLSQSKKDLIGAMIGDKYLVRTILGEGGMGTVYEAEHQGIGRSVAVKVLHPQQMRKKEAVKRFHHEARAAGAIGHPNICEVYDLGTLPDGRPYLVMEKLVGETLAERIREDGGLPFAEVVDVLTQVLSGLVAAHAKGILHRDIKPENVFLTARVGCPPVAKLLDFGVSKMLAPLDATGEKRDGDDEMDLTRTGMVMGTPYYMSPEQARGDRNLDGRVDLYACGVLAYEAVTARRPFLGNNYNALLLHILNGKLQSPRELRPDLPPAFERVIEKAMARKREDRYSNATEFQYDLQRLRAAPPPPRARPRALAPRAAPPPILDVSGDAQSSVNMPVAARAHGFDDLPTEVQLRDFSLQEEDDEVATALMQQDELNELAQRSRTAEFDDKTTKMDQQPSMPRSPLPPRRVPKAR